MPAADIFLTRLMTDECLASFLLKSSMLAQYSTAMIQETPAIAGRVHMSLVQQLSAGFLQSNL